MRGHTRPQSIYRLQAEKHAAERARRDADVRAEATAILAERGYRLVSLDTSMGVWLARFAPAIGDGEAFEARELGGNTLLSTLRVYPKRVAGGPFINGALITKSFIDHTRQGLQALAGFARPQ